MDIRHAVTKKRTFVCCLMVMLCILIGKYYICTSCKQRQPSEQLNESLSVKEEHSKLIYHEFQSVQQDSSSQISSNRNPCFDIYDLNPKKPAAASKSNMSLLEPVNKAFQLGDDIMVRIKLYDGDGKPKLVGGDHVRVWMVDKSKKASSAGYVIDHGNGSYTGHLKALWVGTPVIRASIAITCEGIGVRHHSIKVPGKLRRCVGVFEFLDTSEETQCQPSPDLKEEFCNFTAENYGLPWFCTRPKNKKLICQDWVKIRGANLFNYSDEEKAIIKGHILLKPDIGVNITTQDKKNLFVSPPSVPCNKLPISSTWREKSPAGFFFQDRWLSTHCSYTIEDNMAAYFKCLKNRSILIMGDSTIRQWFIYLEEALHFTRIQGYLQHRPMLTVNKIHNVSMSWAAHGLPFWFTISPNNKGFIIPPHVYLDKIPQGRKDIIIIINLYVHFSIYDPNILRLQAQALVKSIISLKARSPNVTIAFKGYHAFRNARYLPLADYWASVYELIIKKLFEPIKDIIIYLNIWDMTVACENGDVHNSKQIDKEMIHNALNHICRWI